MTPERRLRLSRLPVAFALAVGSTLGCPAGDDGSVDGDGSTGTSGNAVEASTGAEGGDGASSGTVDDTGPVDDASSSTSSSGGSTGEPLDCGATLFVNFDGAMLSAGPDDAPNDTTQIGQITELGPYERAADVDEVMAIIDEHLAPFDVCATRVRPEEGPYTMIVVTSDDPPFPGIFAIGPLDCGNPNANNVGFVFAGDPSLIGARAIANVVSGTFGTTVGLENQEADDGDLMCRLGCSVDVDRTFTDTCLALSSQAPPECSEHTRHCAEGEQNAYQEMLASFGPAQ